MSSRTKININVRFCMIVNGFLIEMYLMAHIVQNVSTLSTTGTSIRQLVKKTILIDKIIFGMIDTLQPNKVTVAISIHDKYTNNFFVIVNVFDVLKIP